MRFDFIRRTERDVDTTTVRFPARYARCVALVGIGNAPVVFFAILVLDTVSGVGSRRSQNCSMKFSRSSSVGDVYRNAFLFVVGEDIADIFLHPLFEGTAQLVLRRRCEAASFLLFLESCRGLVTLGSGRPLRRSEQEYAQSDNQRAS